MNRTQLKFFACFAMLVDHIGHMFFSGTEVGVYMRLFGRLSFPLFAWMIANSWAHTSNRKKFLNRLFLFAFIAQIPYGLVFGHGEMNILFLFVLAIGLFVLYDQRKDWNPVVVWGAILAIIAVTWIFQHYYNAYCLTLTFLFYRYRDNLVEGLIPICVISFLFNFFLNPLQLGMLIPLFIIPFYNGNPGSKRYKMFFYWFYPGHLLAIYIASLFAR